MKKKVLSALMCATMLATMVSGCGSSASGKTGSSGGDDKDSVSESGTEESTEAEAITTTAGDENGTHMEMWSFVELHNTFYADMVEKWNAENPDRTIYVTFTTYPYADMHDK